MGWDAKALSIVSGMEQSIKRLDLDCQGEFIAVFNAIEMQIESGQPVGPVVRYLADALLALAEARGVEAAALRLPEKVENLLHRLEIERR
jgi:hypothetical protein